MMLVGFAKDIHKLYKNKHKKLILGGYEVKNIKYKIKSHSDGDIILHTIADAIYSIISTKDIGQHFNDSDLKNKDLDSMKILNHSLKLLKEAKYKIISNINLTIICNKILLSNIKDNIINSLNLLLPDITINIKAKRFEKTSSMIECYCLLIASNKQV